MPSTNDIIYCFAPQSRTFLISTRRLIILSLLRGLTQYLSASAGTNLNCDISTALPFFQGKHLYFFLLSVKYAQVGANWLSNL